MREFVYTKDISVKAKMAKLHWIGCGIDTESSPLVMTLFVGGCSLGERIVDAAGRVAVLPVLSIAPGQNVELELDPPRSQIPRGFRSVGDVEREARRGEGEGRRKVEEK